MPTHWHMVLYPAADGELSRFLRWLTLTHAVRWQKHYQVTGSGHVYPNRFKAFAIEEDQHLYSVLRYVERNALRFAAGEGTLHHETPARVPPVGHHVDGPF